jgi:hypothetical protein
MIQTSLECCLGGCPWRQGDRSHVIGVGASGAGCVRYTAGTVAGVTNVPKGPKWKTRQSTRYFAVGGRGHRSTGTKYTISHEFLPLPKTPTSPTA